jgi:hypothetical protein
MIAGYVAVESATIPLITPGQPIEVSIKNLEGFPFDQQNGTIDDVPQPFRNFDGKRVTFIGEMWAPDQATPKLSHFEMCYRLPRNDRNPPPLIQEYWQCKPIPGVTVYYSDGLVRVTGILHVDVRRKGGRVINVYNVDVEKVEPLKS